MPGQNPAARALTLLLTTARLIAVNRISRLPVTGEAPCLVSVASYGFRKRSAYLALESIAHGRVRPERLVLVLDEADRTARLPRTLLRLQARGLEIRFAEAALGPHKKWFWPLRCDPGETNVLVTADDDVLYPEWWLEGLRSATDEFRTEDVVCFRAKTVILRDGGLDPYRDWPGCTSDAASPLTFPTGNSGVAYPVSFQRALIADGDGFRETCPRADDVWLHSRAVRHGHAVRQVFRSTRAFFQVPSSQKESLMANNVAEGQNDVQIRATYSAAEIDTLVAAQSSL